MLSPRSLALMALCLEASAHAELDWQRLLAATDLKSGC